jgi:hypothetical protein
MASSKQVILPVIQRLHLHNLPSGADCKRNLFLTLARCAPALTHLRISGISQYLELSMYLGATMQLPSYMHCLQQPGDTLVHLRVPPQDGAKLSKFSSFSMQDLCVIIVEPREVLRGSECGTASRANSQMITFLRRLALDIRHVAIETQLRQHPRLIVLPPKHHADNPAKTRREWEEINAGGLGAWDEDLGES